MNGKFKNGTKIATYPGFVSVDIASYPDVKPSDELTYRVSFSPSHVHFYVQQVEVYALELSALSDDPDQFLQNIEEVQLHRYFTDNMKKVNCRGRQRAVAF